MRVDFPKGARLFCRSCQAEQPHNVDPADRQYVRCEECGRRILGAEIMTTYAYDYQHPVLLMLPLRLYTVGALARRVAPEYEGEPMRERRGRAMRLKYLAQHRDDPEEPLWDDFDAA